MKIPLAHVHARAAERPPEYAAEVMAAGTVSGDSIDIPDPVLAGLVEKYAHGPSIIELAANFAAAVARWQLAGRPVVTEDVFTFRRGGCQGDASRSRCEFWSGKRCMVCGCPARKLVWATEECPLPEPRKRWGKAV